jgi:hypothetical protein
MSPEEYTYIKNAIIQGATQYQTAHFPNGNPADSSPTSCFASFHKSTAIADYRRSAKVLTVANQIPDENPEILLLAHAILTNPEGAGLRQSIQQALTTIKIFSQEKIGDFSPLGASYTFSGGSSLPFAVGPMSFSPEKDLQCAISKLLLQEIQEKLASSQLNLPANMSPQAFTKGVQKNLNDLTVPDKAFRDQFSFSAAYPRI